MNNNTILTPIKQAMLEVLGGVLIIAIVAVTMAIAFAAAGAAAAVGGLLLAGLACIGWLPILICAVSVEYEIGAGFTGSLAYFAMWLYLALSGAIIVIGFTVPDPDKIPPGFKFLALFYTHPVEGMSLVAAPRRYVAEVTAQPANPIWARVEARRFQKMADDAEARAAHSAAAARLLKAQEELARAEALEKAMRRKRDGG